MTCCQGTKGCHGRGDRHLCEHWYENRGSKSKSVQKRLKAQGARRFNVHVEREVIVYAATPDDAGRKVIAHLMKTTTEPPAERKMRVVAIEELPETDDCGPIIDGAPPRETRG